MSTANETKELVVTMNCKIELGCDPVKNAETVKRIVSWGFEIIGVDNQRMDLQYVNGNIFDRNPETLAGQKEPVALPEEKNPSVKISTRRSQSKSPEHQANAETVACCALCEKKVRADGKNCPQCDRRVCSACKNFYKGGICLSCAEQPNTKDASIKPAAYSIVKPTKGIPKPTVDSTLCSICKKNQKSKQCPVCSKSTCAGCYNRGNDSCKECAAIE